MRHLRQFQTALFVASVVGAATLTERVVATAQYDKVVSITLVSDYDRKDDVRRVTKTQATKENLKAVLEILSGKRPSVANSMEEIENLSELHPATPNDLVLIMYSSHGYRDNRTGNFYFIPYDTERVRAKCSPTLCAATVFPVRNFRGG